MRTLADYLDLVIEKHDLKSDRQLAKLLEVSHHTIHCFRHSRNLPADNTMIRIANLAEIDPRVALAELGFLRSAWKNDPETAAVYKSILTALPRIAAMLAIVAVFCGFPSDKASAFIDYDGGNMTRTSYHVPSAHYILWKVFSSAFSAFRGWVSRLFLNPAFTTA